MSVALIETLGLSHYFKANLGADTLAVRKPDPLHLLTTLERLGQPVEEAVMLGDSMTDVKTAKAAGVPIVAVSFGYTDIPAADFGAEAVSHHFDQALAAIQMCHTSR